MPGVVSTPSAVDSGDGTVSAAGRNHWRSWLKLLAIDGTGSPTLRQVLT